jgi:hypothetical protein
MDIVQQQPSQHSSESLLDIYKRALNIPVNSTDIDIL